MTQTRRLLPRHTHPNDDDDATQRLSWRFFFVFRNLPCCQQNRARACKACCLWIVTWSLAILSTGRSKLLFASIGRLEKRGRRTPTPNNKRERERAMVLDKGRRTLTVLVSLQEDGDTEGTPDVEKCLVLYVDTLSTHKPKKI